jgi:biopolymer transport protein ExbD
VTRDGSVYFGTERTTADDLTNKVKDRLVGRLDKRVYLKADARAKFGAVVQVVDAVRAAGVDDVGLLTAEKKPQASPPPPPAGQ